MKRFGRICCLMLAVLMLFNCYMIPRANAVAFEGLTVGYVAAGVLVPAMCAALGISAVNNAGGWDAFRTLCNSVSDKLLSIGVIQDNKIPVIKYGGLNYVAGLALDAVKNVFFADKFVSVPVYASGETSGFGNSCLYRNASAPVYWAPYYYRNQMGQYFVHNVWFSGARFDYVFTLEGSSTTWKNAIRYKATDQVWYCFASGDLVNKSDYPDVAWHTASSPGSWVSANLNGYTPEDAVYEPIEGLVYGSIKPLPQKDIETNYVTWGNTALQVEEFPEPDDGGDNDPNLEPGKFFPILLPDWDYQEDDDPEEYPDQEEIQDPPAIIDPNPDPGPGPSPDPDPGPNPDPDPGPNPDPDPGPHPTPNPGPFPEIDTDVPNMVYDLRDLFPFCIPFDLYRLLSVLSADPVAPEFDLPLHGFNREFTIHVDLSAFDTIAMIVRNFELMGFIVGLGLATRNRFLRG